MKNTVKRIFSFMMAIFLFVSYPLSVYASEDHPWQGGLGLQLYYNLDEIKQYIKETKDFWVYAAHQVGAVVKADFTTFMNNSDKFDELCGDDKVGLYKDDSGNVKGVYLSKEFMAQFKALLDEYAKEENAKEENGGFIIVPTMDMSTVPTQWFLDGGNYKTFRNLMIENGLLMVTPKNDWGSIGAYFLFADPFYDHTENKKTDILLVADKGSLERYKADSSLTLTANFYDGNLWRSSSVGRYTFRDSDVHASWSEGPQYASSNTYLYSMSACLLNATTDNVKGRNTFLCSLTGEKVRVFVSEIAAQNYSVGNRKVYFTENYYNYVPEDLSVSIDDLQKTVDDLQKVIDELLKQIGNDTSEKEIMDLLKQILEELRNSGGGNGGGNGGGDVNIDIDLSATNSLLSKVLAKVTQIFDKISETATGSVDAVNAKLQETLDEILDTLKSIRRWTIADTVFDGLDALADIASFLKDFLTAPAAAIGTAASSLGDAADMLTDRFPFSIPWDMAALVTLLSAEPQAPVFKLPIVIESYGIEEYIEIDMSQYEYLSTIMRGMLSIIYAYGILSMTTKVIDTGGKK